MSLPNTFEKGKKGWLKRDAPHYMWEGWKIATTTSSVLSLRSFVLCCVVISSA